jgi:hypothetical protein
MWAEQIGHLRSAAEGATAALVEIAEGRMHLPNTRRTAVLLLGELPTQEGMQWCLGNLGLRLPSLAANAESISSPFDDFPCFAALSRAGWAALPVVRNWLATQHLKGTAPGVDQVARLVWGSAGDRQVAQALADAWAHDNAQVEAVRSAWASVAAKLGDQRDASSGGE